jgi:dihydrofolate reductase
MRKLIAWDLMTLDGFFEGRAPWDLSFHEDVWGEELERFSLQQLGVAGGLLFGRKTYEGMAAHWRTAEGEIARRMNDIAKVVFSATLGQADWQNTRLVSGKAEDEVPALKGEPGGDLFVFGSADLTASLTRARLIDEYRICIAPRLLGGGNPLFKQSPEQLELTLLDAQPLATGGVILRYGAAKER